jgi:hypothetical protein
MAYKQTIEIYELLDSAHVDGETIVQLFRERGLKSASTKRLHGDSGYTDLVDITIPGRLGKAGGGNSPTLNLVGSLGGIGGRPELVGLVSDADGAIVALASALKIADMLNQGDYLDGDVIIRTTICTNGPTIPHDPTPFMATYVSFGELRKHIIFEKADGILVAESTKGNFVINHKGFAITPTIKEGWILKVSFDAIRVMERITSRAAVTMPITMQDITPFDNGIYHLNGIGELPEGIRAPAIGVAITTEIPVGGAATGASSVADMEPAVRFCVEIAKDFGRDRFQFYDKEEFQKLLNMYGSMHGLQTMGKTKSDC